MNYAPELQFSRFPSTARAPPGLEIAAPAYRLRNENAGNGRQT